MMWPNQNIEIYLNYYYSVKSQEFKCLQSTTWHYTDVEQGVQIQINL